MRPRVRLGRFLARLGQFIASLSVCLMKPDDLLELNRQRYARPHSLEEWSAATSLARGLSDNEKALLEKVPLNKGKLLLLGIGGGRDAIALAQRGFDIVGVDFIPEMAERAKQNAARSGVNLEVLVQDYSQLAVPAGSFDLAVIFAAMYSSIPTREKRLEMVRKIFGALKPGGYFACQFLWDERPAPETRPERLRKLFALAMGNPGYERGDTLWSSEFLHAFISEKEIISEFNEGGFRVVHLQTPKADWAGAVLVKD